MNNRLLQTKLYTPANRTAIVPRTRLLNRLHAGLDGKLTLLSAPAGFGKTTLVVQWLAQLEQPTAWVSLDEDDSSPHRFFSYVAAAIRPFPDHQDNLNPLLTATPQTPAKMMAATLVNDLATVSTPSLIVLDDYHLVDSTEIDAALAYLLTYLPAQIHLIITTREDPSIPLARYRARGQLTELRAADLRFTEEETTQFFTQMGGLSLSSNHVATLKARTEGWIAGLQLAALSMQNQADPAAFIAAFSGSHRFVLDYLADEVLLRQPEPVRTFLLQTAILEELNDSLCNAVTGREDGKAQLATLEQENLFLIPLDDRRRWYRYHHLFADVLRAHLQEEMPELLPELQRRASDWYAANGRLAEAIRHALAAPAHDRAARLLELCWREMDQTLQSAKWLDWVNALPEALSHDRPVLNVGVAWAMLNAGQLEMAEARLQEVAQWLEETAVNGWQTPAVQAAVADEREFHLLPGTIASARAYSAQAQGDVAKTVRYVQQALALLPEDAYVERAVPGALLGLTYWAQGELDGAFQALADSMAAFQMSGNLITGITAQFGMADIRVIQGRLREAIAIFEETLALVARGGMTERHETADLHLQLGDLYQEQGNEPAAHAHWQQSEALGKPRLHLVYDYHLSLHQARQKEAEGEIEAALRLLEQAEQQFEQIHIPDVAPVAAIKARMWVRQGWLDKAHGWAQARGLSTEGELDYLHEFEHITLARLLLAQFEQAGDATALHRANILLERLEKAAEAGRRLGRVMEILLLRALVQQAQDDLPAALRLLERALTLAEPEGYRRIFVQEGEPLASLLRKLVRQGRATDYAHRLLVALDEREGKTAVSQPPSPPAAHLPDPLSERELEVLQLLTTDLTGPEIARELTVSLNTIRTHTKNIYSKLGVNSRRTAVRRAEELNLL